MSNESDERRLYKILHFNEESSHTLALLLNEEIPTFKTKTRPFEYFILATPTELQRFNLGDNVEDSNEAIPDLSQIFQPDSMMGRWSYSLILKKAKSQQTERESKSDTNLRTHPWRKKP